MKSNLQPLDLKNEYVCLIPLKPEHFERLYKVASDPLIWEQHPHKDRYRRNVFIKFFEAGIASNGAFLVLDTQTREIIGSSRFYEYNPVDRSVAIGYTFLARSHWGSTYNRALKYLMLNYAFGFSDKVIFHIGENNIRSQKAVEKLGAVKTGKRKTDFLSDDERLDFIYEIDKADWLKGSI